MFRDRRVVEENITEKPLSLSLQLAGNNFIRRQLKNHRALLAQISLSLAALDIDFSWSYADNYLRGAEGTDHIHRIEGGGNTRQRRSQRSAGRKGADLLFARGFTVAHALLLLVESDWLLQHPKRIVFRAKSVRVRT